LLNAIRLQVRNAIEVCIEEELVVALGACPYARSLGRLGYRNGASERLLVTEVGPQRFRMPRARLFEADGSTREWSSQLLPRYERRTRQVNEAVLGAYLAGANTRRIRLALRPLLGETALSKSAISRVVQRLRDSFTHWRQRDLSSESYAYLYLDAMNLPVRIARRVVKIPVQAVLGVEGRTGQKVLVALEIAASESTASWTAIVQDLVRRGLPSPRLVILDGNPGLRRAVREAWPRAAVQRCVKHKLENLLSKAPKHCHAELKRDYGAITHAETEDAARRAYDAFSRKWRKLSPEVLRSLEEAGVELLSFYRFPKSQWKSLRTTNQIERLNEEFRRRTKTQGAFTNDRSALVLLYGLIAMGQIALRKIDGCYDMHRVTDGDLKAAA
jgi:transposase-like protein